jgi:hypothetical protein
MKKEIEKERSQREDLTAKPKIKIALVPYRHNVINANYFDKSLLHRPDVFAKDETAPKMSHDKTWR